MDTKNISIAYGADKKFDAYVVAPEKLAAPGEKTAAKRPGLIVIEEVWGVNAHIRDVCDRFAAEGYVVMSPELLGETGILEKMSSGDSGLVEDLFGTDPEKKHAAQAVIREIMQPMSKKDFAADTMAKLAAAFEYLSKDPRVAGAPTEAKIGVVGFCFGGTYAFNLATVAPRLKACVIFYGQAPNPLELVEKIPCPVLELNGEKDERVIAGLPALTEVMEKYGKDFTSKVYPGTGHAFFNDTNRHAYDAAAAQDAWELTTAFLKKNLG